MTVFATSRVSPLRRVGALTGLLVSAGYICALGAAPALASPTASPGRLEIIEVAVYGEGAARADPNLTLEMEAEVTRALGARFQVVDRTGGDRGASAQRCASPRVGDSIASLVCIRVGAETRYGHEVWIDIHSDGFILERDKPQRIALDRVPQHAAQALITILGRRTIDHGLEIRAERRRPQRTGRVTFLAPAGGRISVDGKAFRRMPATFDTDDAHHDVVVHLDDCGVSARSVLFTTLTIEWACVERSAPITIATTRDTIVKLTIDGRGVIQRPLRPSEQVLESLPMGSRRVVVECATPQQIGWRQIYTVGAYQGIDVLCRPWPRDRWVRLRSTVAGTRFRIDSRNLPTPVVEQDPRTDHPERHEVLEANRWYVTTHIEKGRHTLCAFAPMHRPDCKKIEVVDGQDVLSVAFEPVRIPAPPADSLDEAPSSTSRVQVAAAPLEDGPVSLGLGGGMTFKHHRWFAAIGPVARFGFDTACVREGTRRCLELEASWLLELTESPIFLSRYEPAQRATRGHLALRWVMWRAVVEPSIALGGFFSPSIGAGPWLGGAVTLRQGPFAFDIGSAMPVFLPSREGTFVFEGHVAARFALPDWE